MSRIVSFSKFKTPVLFSVLLVLRNVPLFQVNAIPDKDEKTPSPEPKEKDEEEPMETDKPTNGEKEKDGETAEKPTQGGEETKSPAAEAKMDVSEVKSEDSKAKGDVVIEYGSVLFFHSTTSIAFC